MISAAKVTERREYIDQLKLERGCADCGYATHPAALHFDHLPEFIKDFNISQAIYRLTWELILIEIEKCEVVCANCHAVRTSSRRGEALYARLSRGGDVT